MKHTGVSVVVSHLYYSRVLTRTAIHQTIEKPKKKSNCDLFLAMCPKLHAIFFRISISEQDCFEIAFEIAFKEHIYILGL